MDYAKYYNNVFNITFKTGSVVVQMTQNAIIVEIPEKVSGTW